MTDNPEWFAPKRYGYGSGRPISWQGWALTILFVATVIGFSILFRKNRLQLLGALVPIVLVYTLVSARTTKGGWRWRWGEKDGR